MKKRPITFSLLVFYIKFFSLHIKLSKDGYYQHKNKTAKQTKKGLTNTCESYQGLPERKKEESKNMLANHINIFLMMKI